MCLERDLIQARVAGIKLLYVQLCLPAVSRLDARSAPFFAYGSFSNLLEEILPIVIPVTRSTRLPQYLTIISSFTFSLSTSLFSFALVAYLDAQQDNYACSLSRDPNAWTTI